MYLTDVVSQSPPHTIQQDEFLAWLAAVHPDSVDEITRVCCKSDKISKRHTCVPAFDLIEDFGERGQIFQSCTEQVFDSFYPPSSAPPRNLIHVTCTGYQSPSAAQTLASRRGWGADTIVTHAYHMGCLAALSAIRMGVGFATLSQKSVDLVHTELSSLHFTRSLKTAEQFVSFSLFGDGLIKYSLTPQPQGPSFKILVQREEIIPETEEMMKWETATWGLKMTLSKRVPAHIQRAIVPFVERLTHSHNVRDAIFAIHPGGPKIIEMVEKKLQLSKKQVAATENILYTRGNMSSATLPHIWEQILYDESYPSGSLIVGLAFGPGLTMSGILLEKVT